jgi:hypothetical protein
LTRNILAEYTAGNVAAIFKVEYCGSTAPPSPFLSILKERLLQEPLPKKTLLKETLAKISFARGANYIHNRLWDVKHLLLTGVIKPGIAFEPPL